MSRIRPASRFLSVDECQALAARVAHFGVGGGQTSIAIESTWTGNLRWARNQALQSEDVRNNVVTVRRDIRGAAATMDVNQIDDGALLAAVRRAERALKMRREERDSDLREFVVEPYLRPKIWFDSSYDLDADRRTAAMEPVVQAAVAAGMRAAGYLEVAGHGRAAMDATTARALYYPYTTAQFSVTVRDPHGAGSGWAGVDFNDWERIDVQALSATALDKCLRSRNPVAIEPGRYTAILEPQAVCDLMAPLMSPGTLSRVTAETGIGPFAKSAGDSMIGDKVLDERLTITHDPMDPDTGFPPFASLDDVYHAVNWVEKGVLKELAYNRQYAIAQLGTNTGLPASGAFRMSGGTTTLLEMIASTARGILVTRLSHVQLLDFGSMLMTGYTRDGLWLIENGKITKPVKNFRFVESPLFAFNNIEQLGAPRRAFHPNAPVVVPSVKVRDFSFPSLADSV
ncbi:MAG TPA: metallopeptidase TldD-related protein [Gemmatimonadaceae bacterium]|jgi:predicted Zn-dependent protease|nr:metallopeptidase TldD-related protein [Gemmatimonadaceae bacterium]